MKKVFLVSSLLPLMISPFTSAGNAITHSVDDNIVKAGDMIQILLPATGLFASWMYDDLEGAKQLTYSTLSTQMIIHGAKNTIGRKRPNDSNWQSFPSGHTGAAFSGAAFLQSRYGSNWGIPAYAAATFVGASRIHGNRHFAGDVVAGASIGFLMNQYFVSPYHVEGIYLSAQPTSDGVAVGVTITNDAFNAERTYKNATQLGVSELKHRIELGVGGIFSDSSAQAGAEIFLSQTELIDEFQPFAYVNYGYELENNNQFELEFSPNETRRRGKVSKTMTMDGETFEAGDEVYTAFRHWMLGTSVYKGLEVNEQLNIDIGLGVYVHRFGFDIANEEDENRSASKEHWRVMPSATIKAQYFFNKEISTLAKMQYQGWEGDSYFASEIGLNYQINPAWDVGVKYGYSETTLDNTSFNSSYDGETVILTFANRF